jgi:prophage antirepressor-like protein
MDILRTFVFNGSEHNVTILWDKGEPLIKASDLGAVLGISNIRERMRCFDETEKVVRKVDTLGGAQDVTFLTQVGAYILVMRSNKPIARPFQKWLAHVVQDIQKNGEYKLIQQNEELRSALERERDRFKEAAARARHETLVETFRGPDRYLVYFGKVGSFVAEQGKELIKIGRTDQLQGRAIGLAKDFGDITIIEVFECAMNQQFERFLHFRFKKMAFRGPTKIDGHRSNEVFLMTQEELDLAIRIARKNVNSFTTNNFNYSGLLEDEEAEAGPSETIPVGQTEAHATFVDPQPPPHAAPPDVFIPPCTRRYTQARGSKVQRYSADGKVLLQTYVGLTDVARDTSLDSPVEALVRNAAKEKRVYKGFRWALLDREQPDDTFQNIEEATTSATVRKGFVAMLDLDRTRIVKVFCDQKAAAEDRQFKGCAAISTAIANGTKSGGHYFAMWHGLDEGVKEEYLSREDLPQKRVQAQGRQVAQVHPVTRSVVKTYASVADVTREMRIARASLVSAIESGGYAKNYMWQWWPCPQGAGDGF